MTDTNKFSSFFLRDTTIVDIDLPNGEPAMTDAGRVSFEVYGPATEEYKKANDALSRESVRRYQNTLNIKGMRKEKEDQDADVKFLLSITKRVINFDYEGGIEAIYREPHLSYMADQVRAAVSNGANFFKGAETP
jgi:hypothetical protein